jgi:23S rRNA pseudouridine1911/1915/1917 synthase
MSLHVLASFQVIDESEDWIVVDKPAPLIVHPANRKPEPTLLGGLEHLLAFEIQTGGHLGIITRLDRETSGVVLVAKTLAAARELGGIFERREAGKEYLAIVRGWPAADSWECDEPLLRAGKLAPSPIWVKQIPHPTGRACRTRFRVEQRFHRNGQEFSQIRCFPETGRLHQIRVHLACGGHPIVGDKLYAADGQEYLEWMETGWTPMLEERLLLPRHALHAAALEIHWKGQTRRWQAPLPTDLVEFIGGKALTRTPGLVIWSRHE